MKDICIVGAGGFGAQTAFLIEAINAVRAEWRIRGYVDADDTKQGTDIYGYGVLGPEVWLRGKEEGMHVVLGIGYPEVKREAVRRLENYGRFVFPNLVHPSAIMSRAVHMGCGNVIDANGVIKTNITIGSFVTVNTACVLGHDVTIEDFASLMPTVNVSGKVSIGEGAFVGSNATILQDLRVGRGAVIGAGAVVTKDIPDHCTAVGVPARVIKRGR